MSPKANGSSIGTKGVAVERQLPCKLTEAEVIERGESMAEAELQIDSLKADRRAVQKQINEQIDLRNKLAHTIDSGEEMRVVQCRWKASESEKLWRLMREDTGTEIEDRPMTAADLQGSLSFPADDDAPAPTPLQKVIASATEKLAKTMKSKPAAVSGGGKSKGKGKSKGSRAHA